jgi:hypothetical protein
MSLAEVRDRVTVSEKKAKPVSPHKITSPWITGTIDELAAATKCFGESAYQGRYGTHCHASGIYWVTVLSNISKNKLLIKNLGGVGKTKFPSVEHRVDAQFVHPLARGRDIEKWSISPRCWMILAQDQNNPAKAVNETVLRSKFADTFEYFKQIRKNPCGHAAVTRSSSALELTLFTPYIMSVTTPFPNSRCCGVKLPLISARLLVKARMTL